MFLNDNGTLLTAVRFQMSLYDGCRPLYSHYVMVMEWLGRYVIGDIGMHFLRYCASRHVQLC